MRLWGVVLAVGNEVEHVATAVLADVPAERVVGLFVQAIVIVPSLNVTVPVGVPAPGGVTETVSVKVTDWPAPAGLGLAINDDVVAP